MSATQEELVDALGEYGIPTLISGEEVIRLQAPPESWSEVESIVEDHGWEITERRENRTVLRIERP